MPRTASTSRPHTTTTRATMSALETPDGAIPNVSLPKSPRRQARHAPDPRSDASKIVIVQPAARHWRCDGCHDRGFGGGALLEHFQATGHKVYTPLD